jgi:hypothetical protein
MAIQRGCKPRHWLIALRLQPSYVSGQPFDDGITGQFNPDIQ